MSKKVERFYIWLVGAIGLLVGIGAGYAFAKFIEATGGW